MKKTQIALLKALEAHFKQAAIKEKAAPMSAYMRNQFSFLGLPAPIRKTTQKAFWAKRPLPQGEDLFDFVQLLWAQDYRELHYQAMELLEKHLQKTENAELLPFLLQLLLSNSWWDSCDYIGPKLIGSYLQRFPSLKTEVKNWAQSEDLWLRRTALLFQLRYKDKTDWPLLQEIILELAPETDFFIRKAIGWSLREYSKTNGPAVTTFIHSYEAKLSGLSQREGLKWLKNQQKNG